MAGITNEEGQLYQSYRYGAAGEITFGAPQYENEYTYNSESYNPNIQSQYLRARYYEVAAGSFLTEDSYLGNIREPLTLNRYSYCVGNPVNYKDPSGHVYVMDAQGKMTYNPNTGKVVGKAEDTTLSRLAAGVQETVNLQNISVAGSQKTYLKGKTEVAGNRTSSCVQRCEPDMWQAEALSVLMAGGGQSVGARVGMGLGGFAAGMNQIVIVFQEILNLIKTAEPYIKSFIFSVGIWKTFETFATRQKDAKEVQDETNDSDEKSDEKERDSKTDKKRGVGGKGWRGDKTWKGNVKKVGEGGTIEDLNGQVPTQQEAIDLIKESGGTINRIEGPHNAPNPHNFNHINYTTPSGGKGTIKIK